MPLYIKQNNTWTKLNKFHNVNGTNKEILNQYHKINGTWKPVYSYSWNVSEWSSCSKPCGTGIQTRTATCVRNDGIVKEDKFCTLSGVNKPVLQQYCNSQPCTYYLLGEKDDCMALYVKKVYHGPWNQVIYSCGAHDQHIYYPFDSSSIDGAELVYVKFTTWDTNGTSWHFWLQLCTAYNVCTPMIARIPKQGAGSQGWFWIEWNTKKNTAQIIACADGAENLPHQCGKYVRHGLCNASGVGYIGCGLQEPF